VLQTEARKALKDSTRLSLKFSTVKSMSLFLNKAGAAAEYKVDWQKMFPLQTAEK